MACKKGKEQVFYMRLWSLLLSTVAKVVLDQQFSIGLAGQDMSVLVEGGVLIELKKIAKR